METTSIFSTINHVDGAVPLSPSSSSFLTDVVVVGNGPSGLALSAFLSGWRPFYDHSNPHSDRRLHDQLSTLSCSLFDQDLSWAVDLFQDVGSLHPIATLYDSLVRPDADMGHQHHSSLRWTYTCQTVPHIVLGVGPPGGSWNNYDDDVISASLSTWMDLPGFSMAEWLNGKFLCARLPCLVVRKYFRSYPKHAGICKHLLNFTTVDDIQKDFNDQGRQCWDIRGRHSSGQQFHFRAKNVVLATGLGRPNLLNIKGERNYQSVVYNLLELKMTISNASSNDDLPVVVVGDGLSAADVILYCLARRLSVEHIFSRSQREIKDTSLGRLSKTLYPEYQTVLCLMLDRLSDPCYRSHPRSSVQSVISVNQLTLLGPTDHSSVLSFRYLAICIGRQSTTVDFLSNLSQQALQVNVLNYESTMESGLYCVGPLAGDYFVRFLVGGCLAASKHITQCL